MIRVRETPEKATPEIRFPVRWTFRAVVEASDAAAVHGLDAVLEECGFAESFVEAKSSANGKYRSFHVEVTLHSKQQMDDLGARLGAVPGVKFLL